MIRIAFAITLALVAWAAIPTPALGWGPSGHKIVGKIAWRYLTPEARQEIANLIGERDLVDVANWADYVRSNRVETAPWHFVNVPRSADTVDVNRDCTDQGCVITAINEQAQILGNTDEPELNRVEALKFLVHFVGDIHQPLHVSYEDDHGGNWVEVDFLGRETKLHRVWDSEMIDERAGSQWWTLANEIMAWIPEQDASDWRADDDPVTWANESLAYTIEVYDYFSEELTAEVVLRYGEEQYLEDVNFVEERLAQAGVRLAALLNGIFEPSAPETTDLASLSVCSFNVQFLGHFKNRDDVALANLVGGYDIVVIQELVAPPTEGKFPDDTDRKADVEAKEFFDAMEALGFQWELSEEDTGTGDKIHVNSSGTEWWVAFYDPDRVSVANDLPSGFLADDRANHDDYERVPYAFAFRSDSSDTDFVLISVHLQPGDRRADMDRRDHELSSIADWIEANDDEEKDFIILGDMNIKDADELASATPSSFVSLNSDSLPTNTNVNGPRPYDHVMYRPGDSSEIDLDFGFVVIDLIEEMSFYWDGDPLDYPGKPYDHNAFRVLYSDHHPVVFRIKDDGSDDD